MFETTMDRARELGRHLGQTPEYQALSRARQRVSEDPGLTALLNQLAELEVEVARALERGQEPAAATAEAYEKAFSDLQGSSVYQSLIAAQSNFDKVLARVNEEIGKGMEAATQSRIILPS
ncbi:MAG TPA: YlbF family regulator [Longimicrobiales bacterium]|nr:YlbF family regulator [Longimicrobiales bacterium]